MYWLDTEVVPGEKTGLTLVVDDDRRPGLVLESSPRTGRLRLRTREQPLLWARVEGHYAGVWVLRRSTRDSPAIVRPIRASEARTHGTMCEWKRFFATELDVSPRSPLARGTWQLSELRQRAHGSVELAKSTLPDVFAPPEPDAPPPGRKLISAPTTPRLVFQEWSLSSASEVFPLRAFSVPDAPRVKAWRKHARDGILPPLLLWYVGGLELPLLIDGHDRLRVSIAEEVTPRVVQLWQSIQRPDVGSAAWRADVVESYAKAHQRADRLSDSTRHLLNDALVRAFRGGQRDPITIARATPGSRRSGFARCVPSSPVTRATTRAKCCTTPSDSATPRWSCAPPARSAVGERRRWRGACRRDRTRRRLAGRRVEAA